MDSIDIRFDHDILLKDYNLFLLMTGYAFNTINLTRRADMSDDNGLSYGHLSLYDYVKKKYVIEQSEYDTEMDFVYDTYTSAVLHHMRELINMHGMKMGRARYIPLRPKECLTYHTDPESALRFHIPVQTNDNVLFVIDDTVERMSIEGMVYMLDTSKKHTVMNASRELRVHLVCDAYIN